MRTSRDRIQHVIAEGQQSREDLAAQLAREFQDNPARFDPRRLERLGGTGLRQFLGEVGLDGVSIPHGSPKPRSAPTRFEGRASRRFQVGWRHLRRPEYPVWVSATAASLRAGLLIVAVELMALFAVERLYPMVGVAL